MPETAPTHQTEWRQGSIVPHALVDFSQTTALFAESPRDDAVLILVSHDCDIVHRSHDSEPHVEILVGRLLPKGEEADGAFLHGRNPRCLHFELQTPDGKRFYYAKPTDRFWLSRAALLKGKPDNTMRLTPETVEIIASWLAKRYNRAAFPDEFNKRLNPALSRIKKSLKKKGRLLTAIFLRLDRDDDVPAGEDYHVVVAATAMPEVCESSEEEKEAISLLVDIERAFDSCDGISVLDARLFSETEFSLHDIRHSRRWDFDYLSYREGESESIAPQG